MVPDRRSLVRSLGTLALSGAVLSACEVDQSSPFGSDGAPVAVAAMARAQAAQAETGFVVISQAAKLPAKMAKAVEAAGGRLTNIVPQIGMIVAASDDPQFVTKASKIKGVRAVVPDLQIEWGEPIETELGVDATFANPPNSGDDDFFFDLQWGHAAVDAVRAWNMGYRGAGVRVAVLDSGIDSDHPDIAPNLNVSLSASFVPGEPVDVGPGFFFNHGTHVAGTVAAADNGFGVIGVAPEAELVAVKVLSQFTTSGAFSWIASGIVYAALIDADVINMSLQGILPKSGIRGVVGANEIAQIRHLVDRAVAFAYQSGATVIVAAGNEGANLDGLGPIIISPAESPHAIAVSATAPLGWGIDPTVDLDVPASYTNHGKSIIDLAGPGGDIDLDLFFSGQTCVVVLFRSCAVFDLVFSTIAGGWGWASGTSMATPHVAGVAALIVGANGGDMHPAQVEAALRKGAADLGKPGQDIWYGSGRVDADDSLN